MLGLSEQPNSPNSHSLELAKQLFLSRHDKMSWLIKHKLSLLLLMDDRIKVQSRCHIKSWKAFYNPIPPSQKIWQKFTISTQLIDFFKMKLNISQWQNHQTHVPRNTRTCGWNLKCSNCLVHKPLLQTVINVN